MLIQQGSRVRHRKYGICFVLVRNGENLVLTTDDPYNIKNTYNANIREVTLI